ncbi:DUF6803 family protein [Desulfitobacterium sp. THU1]|uniref:DUF6803 family protein n=1 Tax=Desulfitobacterium sp. THU1 TaxID=3138072 RepID=UPI00311E9901
MGSMTHYMELLASNQPWNLLIFMAVPVICAETLAITELIILFTRNFKGTARKINKGTGIFAGIYFLGIFLYLFTTAVIPITTGGEWRGFADVVAVGFYLLGVVPLGGLALLELGLLGKNRTPEQELALHATFVGIFLVIAHVAMIFGMLDPHLFITDLTQGMPGMKM